MITRQTLIDAMQPVNGRVPTLQEMGDLWGVSRQRVQQRMDEEGLVKPKQYHLDSLKHCPTCGRRLSLRPDGERARCRQHGESRARKARVGDRVRFRDTPHTRHQWPRHQGHSGKVMEVSCWGGTAYHALKYHLACECGKKIGCRSNAFEAVA